MLKDIMRTQKYQTSSIIRTRVDEMNAAFGLYLVWLASAAKLLRKNCVNIVHAT